MRKLTQIIISLLLLIGLMAVSLETQAHNRSQSFSDWVITNDRTEAVFTAKSREITRLQTLTNQPLDTLFSNHLIDTVSVFQGDLPCSNADSATSLPSALGYVRVSLDFDCDPSLGNISININSFFNAASSHVHYANVAFDGQQSRQYLFTDKQRQHEISLLVTSSNRWFDSARQFVGLGVDHIFGGLDHIAFLAALILLLRRFKDLVWIITGFTLGHSVTLYLTVMGWVIPDVPVVEATIGFTIALVAAENIGTLTGYHRYIAYFLASGLLVMGLLNLIFGVGLTTLSILGLILLTFAYLPLSVTKTAVADLRPLITVGFGLIHGFGFASALIEIGLSDTQLWPALLGFNVGIELGQLFIVASLWLVMKQMSRLTPIINSRLAIDLCSALLCGLGFYWFVGRSYGII
jgi:hypothetical protein